MKNILWLIACLLLLGLLLGCGRKTSPIVGTWRGSMTNPVAVNLSFPVTMVFSEDGDDVITLGNATSPGYYTLKDGILTDTPITVPEGQPPGNYTNHYQAMINGNAMTLTDKEMGTILSLTRDK